MQQENQLSSDFFSNLNKILDNNDELIIDFFIIYILPKQ